MLGVGYRIGGNNVLESEYKDLAALMEDIGLFELHLLGIRFTRSNKHDRDTIYSRIDRAITTSISIFNYGLGRLSDELLRATTNKTRHYF